MSIFQKMKLDFFEDQEEYELMIKHVCWIGSFSWPIYGFILQQFFHFKEDLFIRSIIGFSFLLFLINNYTKTISYKTVKVLWVICSTFSCMIIPWHFYFINSNSVYWACSITFFSFLLGYITPLSANFILFFGGTFLSFYLHQSHIVQSDYALIAVNFIALGVANIVSSIIRSQKRHVEHHRDELQRQKEHNAEYSAKIAHEFKNPIHIIHGFADLILDSNDPTEIKEYAGLIKMTSMKLNKQAQDLLNHERFELGFCEMNLRDVDITKFADELKKDLESLALVKENKIIIIPPFKTTIAKIDKDRFLNVIYNLVENALKFTFDKNPVLLEFEVDNRTLIISVVDQGIGIPEHEVANVFKKFYQLESTKKSVGSGIGLSLVRDIVTAHKGEIQVKSKIGKGTTIKIILPDCIQD